MMRIRTRRTPRPLALLLLLLALASVMAGVGCRADKRAGTAAPTSPAQPSRELEGPQLESTEPEAGSATAAPPVAHSEQTLDTQYEHPEGLFSLKHPGEWALHYDGGDLELWGDPDGSVIVIVSLQPRVESNDALVDHLIGLQAGYWEDYAEISRETGTLGGLPATWTERSWRFDGAAWQGEMVAAQRHRLGLLLQTWAPAGRYAELRPVLHAVVESVRLAEAPLPAYDDWERRTLGSDLVSWRTPPGAFDDALLSASLAQHEAKLGGVWERLEWEAREPVEVYLYPSDEDLLGMTGLPYGSPLGGSREVHTVWRAEDDRLGVGHLLINVFTVEQWGLPSEMLMFTGMPVCLDAGDSNPDQFVAERLQAAGQPDPDAQASSDGQSLIPLAALLGDTWYAADPFLAMAEAGSFCCYLLDRDGAESFRAVYQARDLRSAVEEVYGEDLDALEAAWLDSLRASMASTP